MKRFGVLIALLAPLLLLSAASRLRADDEKEIRKEKKKIVVRVPEREIVVDGDDGLLALEDPEVFADLADFEANVPMFFHGRGGYIGVRPVALTPELREHFGAPKDAGVMVGRVEPDGPASKAGLKVGDIVTAADGSRIESARDLVRAIRTRKDGDTVKLDLLRDRSAKSLTVTVAERQGSEIHLGEMGELGPRMRGRRGKDRDFDFHFRAPRPPMPPPPPGSDWEDRLDALENRLKELEGKVQ